MKKNKTLGICGFSLGCIASFMTGFILEKNNMESMIADNVEKYYIANTHTVNMCVKEGQLIYYDGYDIVNIIYDDEYANVTYQNTIDVIDLKDNSEFGIPLSEFDEYYIKTAKKLHSK